MAESQITKTCTQCNSAKPLDQFGKQKNGKHGRSAECRDCKRERERQRSEQRRIERESQKAANALPDGMKQCAECEAVKPLSEFRKESRRKDGHTGACSDCINARIQRYRATPKGKAFKAESDKRYQQTEQGRANARKRVAKWQQTESGKEVRRKYERTAKVKAKRKAYFQTEKGKEVKRISAKKCYDANPEKVKAWNALNNAVQRGKFPRPSGQCSRCDQPATEYHHHNGYDEKHWFDVIPVCKMCHEAEHHGNVVD